MDGDKAWRAIFAENTVANVFCRFINKPRQLRERQGSQWAGKVSQCSLEGTGGLRDEETLRGDKGHMMDDPLVSLRGN